MYNLLMNIEEVEKKLEELEKTVVKVKELVADYKVCTSEITKALVTSAVKKYAASISDFKLEN